MGKEGEKLEGRADVFQVGFVCERPRVPHGLCGALCSRFDERTSKRSEAPSLLSASYCATTSVATAITKSHTYCHHHHQVGHYFSLDDDNDDYGTYHSSLGR